MRMLRPRALLPIAAVVLAAASVVAADAVIMPDGFVIRGEYNREKEVVFEGGKAVLIHKANGFDSIVDGPKNVVFSTHVAKGGKIEKDLPKLNLTVYKTRLSQRGTNAFPPKDMTPPATVPEFNANWWRKIRFEDGSYFEHVEQKITSLDPYTVVIDSPTHTVQQKYHTAELFSPAAVRTLLSAHPDLKDPKDKIDPSRRLSIAAMLKDIGTADPDGAPLWFAAARGELERLKADSPGPWEKGATERRDKLIDEIDAAESRRFVDDLEAAVAAGRYDFAARFLTSFSLKGNDPQENARFSTLQAFVKKVRGEYEVTTRLLRQTLEQVGGRSPFTPTAAVVGGGALKDTTPATPTPALATLIEAGNAVLAELHPDTAGRLELFRSVADQPAPTPAEYEGRLALAVTGWLKGKNGATKDVKAAVRCWQARRLVLGYLRGETANARAALLDDFSPGGKPAGPADLELIGQIVTMIPPPFPADPAEPGVQLPKTAGVDGIVRRNTGPLPSRASGIDYFLRLPGEYHHGRAYPVLVALTTPGMQAEQLLAQLAGHCDRHGYILIAPDWAGGLGGPVVYDFVGKEHPFVTASLRNLLRHFQVDPDRVFLFGFGEGANFALDIGMAHPDLFAGVGGFNPNPPQNLFIEYWRNAQKLPMFFVTGDKSGALGHLRKLYERWVQNGFPALLTVYRGRGAEWYRMELPRLFDWMGRKTRVRGTGSLRLDQKKVEPWQVLRETDDRFYWVGVGDGGLAKTNMLEGARPGQTVHPARFRADIQAGNRIVIDEVIGVKKFTVWLDKDLIDWSRQVSVQVGGRQAKTYTITPDLRVLLEDLYRTGDKKMLFLARLEVGP